MTSRPLNPADVPRRRAMATLVWDAVRRFGGDHMDARSMIGMARTIEDYARSPFGKLPEVIEAMFRILPLDRQVRRFEILPALVARALKMGMNQVVDALVAEVTRARPLSENVLDRTVTALVCLMEARAAYSEEHLARVVAPALLLGNGSAVERLVDAGMQLNEKLVALIRSDIDAIERNYMPGDRGEALLAKCRLYEQRRAQETRPRRCQVGL
jgi:hypothetical protein